MIMIWYLVKLSFLIKLTASTAVFSCDTLVTNDYDPSISPSGNSTEVSFGYRILGLDEISITSNVSFQNHFFHKKSHHSRPKILFVVILSATSDQYGMD